MGSTGATEQNEMTVLVTGFGPFKEQYPQNPAWEITRRLPDYLPPLRAKSSSAAAAASPAVLPPVRILTHPAPVHVSYAVVRELVPELWAPFLPAPPANDDDVEVSRSSTTTTTTTTHVRPRNIDAVIHIGMAGSRMHYSVERRAHRDNYVLRDVDGKVLGDEERRRRAEEGRGEWIWEGCPRELETGLEMEDVVRRWRRFSPGNSDLRISDDAGLYLCDFIYYSSLAHLWKREEHRRVVFLHVPSDSCDSAVDMGRELTLQLIRAICESELGRPKKGLGSQ